MAGKKRKKLGSPGSVKKVGVELSSSEKAMLLENVDYFCSPKHKPPKGHGTQCPKEMNNKVALQLLKDGIDKNSIGKKEDGVPKMVWSFSKEFEQFFEAKNQGKGTLTYHGYPVTEKEVPERIKKLWP